MAKDLILNDSLDSEIVELLNTVPAAWKDFDASSCSDNYEGAVTLLVAAAMVEQRRNMRLRIAGYSKVLCYTFRGTGKQALRQVNEFIAPVLSDMLKEAGKTIKHVFFETDDIFQMRLTNHGCQARDDVAAGQALRVLDYIRKRGIFQFRDEVPSYGVVESLDVKDMSVQQGGSVAVAQAKASIGEIKMQNNVNVDNSAVAEIIAGALKVATASPKRTRKPAKRKSATKPEIDPKRIPLTDAEHRIELLQRWEEQQEKNLGLPRKKKVTLKQFALRMKTSEKLMKSYQAWYRKNQLVSDDFPDVVQTIDSRKLKRWFS